MRICLSSQHNSSSRVAVGELRELREKANDTEGKVVARALMKDKSSEFEFSVVVHCHSSDAKPICLHMAMNGIELNTVKSSQMGGISISDTRNEVRPPIALHHVLEF